MSLLDIIAGRLVEDRPDDTLPGSLPTLRVASVATVAVATGPGADIGETRSQAVQTPRTEVPGRETARVATATLATPATGGRVRLLAEHVRTGVPANGAAPARQCSECRHDVRSAVNPRGGLTSCAVRDDVPLMMPGSRSMRCAAYAPGGSA